MYATRMFRVSNMKLPLFKRLRAKQKEEGDKAFGAFSKKYQMTDTVLGTGSYSEVRLARNKRDATQVAVKIIDKTGLSERELQGLQKEVNILKTLRHKNVVRFYDSYEEEDTMYVVMEFIPGGELFNRIVADDEPFTEADVKRIIRTLGEALKHCKERGVIHRDIKPQNLLLTTKGKDAELKLADFNLSIKIDPEVQNFTILQTMCGTPNYVAPEILTNKPYDFKCDIWSLGVITYLLLSGGYLPFFVEEEGEDGKELLLQKVKRGRWNFYPPEAWTNVSDSAKKFLLGTMERNPERRFDYEMLLNHEWLKEAEQGDKFEPINFESNHYGYYRRKMHMISKVFLAVEEFKEIMEEKEPMKKLNVGQSSNNEFDSFTDLMN